MNSSGTSAEAFVLLSSLVPLYYTVDLYGILKKNPYTIYVRPPFSFSSGSAA